MDAKYINYAILFFTYCPSSSEKKHVLLISSLNI